MAAPPTNVLGADYYRSPRHECRHPGCPVTTATPLPPGDAACGTIAWTIEEGWLALRTAFIAP
jgi:hypothetical protein